MFRIPILRRLRRPQLPAGMRRVVMVRTLRWMGWGFGEALLPIFLYQFSSSFTETGLLSASIDVAFLLSLPFFGQFQEKVSSKTIILIGLLLYPLVGLSFFLAGATGLVIYIVAARVINGIAAAADAIGIDTYIRRHAHGGEVVSDFGYLHSMTEFGWTAAMVVGFFLVPYLPVYVLLFFITPFSIWALFFLAPLRRDAPPPSEQRRLNAELDSYFGIFKDMTQWSATLRWCALLLFAMEAMSVLALFFLPLTTYLSGGSLQEVILMTIVFSLPSISSWWMARVINYVGHKRSILCMLCVLPFFLFITAAHPAFAALVVCGLGLELVAVGISLALQSYISKATTEDHYGRVSGAMEGVGTLADLVAPITIGLLADFWGLGFAFGVMGAVAVALALLFISLARSSRAFR